jgi:hypothetical protein
MLLANSLTTEEELLDIEKEAKEHVRAKKTEAWQTVFAPHQATGK